jgi:hypothetical protein
MTSTPSLTPKQNIALAFILMGPKLNDPLHATPRQIGEVDSRYRRRAISTIPPIPAIPSGSQAMFS